MFASAAIPEIPESFMLEIGNCVDISTRRRSYLVFAPVPVVNGSTSIITKYELLLVAVRLGRHLTNTL
jgi:hypothetical protein